MIRITIELVPHGVEEKKITIGSMDVWNDATGTPWLGSYGFKLFAENGRLLRQGMIGEFHRKTHNAWWLLAGILKMLYPNVERAFRDERITGRETEKTQQSVEEASTDGKTLVKRASPGGIRR